MGLTRAACITGAKMFCTTQPRWRARSKREWSTTTSRARRIITPMSFRGEKHLSIRAFTETQRSQAYERHGGVCPKCGKHYDIGEIEADHATVEARENERSEL